MKEQDYQSLLNRVAKLEREVKELKGGAEKVESMTNAKETTSIPVSPPPMQEQNAGKPVTKTTVSYPFKVAPTMQSKSKTPIPESAPLPKKERNFDFESLLGTWLPRLFMVILIFGVLWGLKVGMDNGYITNPVRIVLGYAASIGLAFIGFRYYRSKNKAFGLTLLGGFIAVGIITTFAAHNLYGYFNPYGAFAISLIFAISGFVLSKKTKSEALMLFSTFAAFLLPFLLEGSGASSLLFVAYVLLLFLFSFQFSLQQGYKYTYYFTFALFHLTYLSYNVLTWDNADDLWFVSAVIVAHLFVLGVYLSGRVAKGIFSEILLYTNFAFAMIWVQLFATDYATEIFGAIAILYIALTVWVFKQSDSLVRGILMAVSVFAAGLLILSFDFESENTRLLLLLLDGTIGLWVGMQYKSLRTIVVSGILYVFITLFILSDITIETLWSMEHVLWVSLIVSLCAIYFAGYQFLVKNFNVSIKRLDISLIAGQVIFLFYLMKLVPVLFQMFDWSWMIRDHFTLLILIIALCSFYFVHKWEHGKYLAYAAVSGFLFIGVVLVFLSNSVIDETFSYAFNTLVEIIYVFLLTHLFITVWRKTTFLPVKVGIDKLAILMQGAYFLFLNKWYLETANQFELSSDYTYLIHTLLLLGFAFVSISAGRKYDWKQVKIIGVVLILVCVLKLFFVDLIAVSLFIRAILFIIVGVVGLLYSRTLFSKK